MGSGSAESLRGAEAVLNRFNNSNPTFIRDPVTPICGCFPCCGQCGTCTGETRWPNKKASTDILCLRSTQPIKEKLHRIGEGIVCCIDGLEEASTLFQAYHIIVPSSQPLKDIMRNREATGRVGKWAAKLNEFTIDYVHRSSIQSQALADFIADWTPGAQDE
jgi:hypothetical protein